MQTFLPYADFYKSAQCLDRQRLGKQRIEVLQLLSALAIGPTTKDGKKTAWYNHPAAKMWKGYENALVAYGHVICDEWKNRGYMDNTKQRISHYYNRELPITNPPWLGDEEFHASHRSNLLRKNTEYYSQFGWSETPDLPYIWPIQ